MTSVKFQNADNKSQTSDLLFILESGICYLNNSTQFITQ